MCSGRPGRGAPHPWVGVTPRGGGRHSRPERVLTRTGLGPTQQCSQAEQRHGP